MSKKIGIFLMIVLGISAVLLMLATAGRGPGAAPAATTVPPTSAPSASAPQTQSTEPTETQPKTTEAVNGENAAAELVRQILDRKQIQETAQTPLANAEGLNQTAAAGCRADAYAHALAELAQERQMNPIAAFWELVYEGLYKKNTDQSDALHTDALSVSAQSPKQYAYSDDGARPLLTDLLALAARMDDGLDMELAVLGANGTVEADQVHFSESEGCRYAYFACASEQSTHILCVYLRADAKGEFVADVEFQLLNMRHATGDELTLAELSRRYDRQAAALMAAAELLMTGQSKAAAGEVPFAYEVGGWNAKLARFHFTSGAEQGTLTNYRLKIG